MVTANEALWIEFQAAREDAINRAVMNGIGILKSPTTLTSALGAIKGFFASTRVPHKEQVSGFIESVPSGEALTVANAITPKALDAPSRSISTQNMISSDMMSVAMVAYNLYSFSRGIYEARQSNRKVQICTESELNLFK